ncbi:hypothetical protein LELO110150_04835 [Legionella longbeachae]
MPTVYVLLDEYQLTVRPDNSRDISFSVTFTGPWPHKSLQLARSIAWNLKGSQALSEPEISLLFNDIH